MNKKIGWFHLKEDHVFTNTFECAAWYENVLVKAGRYPMEVPDYRVNDEGEVHGHIDMVAVGLPGIITSDEFGTRFYGVPVGSYDNTQNKGKASSHCYREYLYAVADFIINGDESIYATDYEEFELLPEYEAREIRFTYDGEEHMTHGIFIKERRDNNGI